MRIATKLYLGFGILLALLLTLGGLATYDMFGVQRELRGLTESDLPSYASVVQILRYFTIESSQAHSYVTTGDLWRRAMAESSGILLDLEIDHTLERAVHQHTGVHQDELQVLRRQLTEFRRDEKHCIMLVDRKEFDRAGSLWALETQPEVEAVTRHLDGLRFLTEEHVVEAANTVVDRTRRLGPASEVVVLLALLAALLAAAAISRSLLLPIRALVRAVDTLAAGDLSARVEWPYPDELGDLAADFNRMADRVGSTIAALHETQEVLKERNQALSETYSTLQQEMELAARIQAEILPTDCRYLDLVAAAEMNAASDIGGDFYDVLPGRPGPEQMGIVIGDVSGKGIASAMMMVFVVTVLREISRRESDPAGVLRQLNRLMRTRFGGDEGMYVTCFLGFLDRSTLRFTFAKAGHEEPLWYHASTGQCEPLSAFGLFVGLFSDGQFETCRLQLEPGDRLVLYTDGIVEARDREGQMFGSDRLAQLVEEWGQASATRIVEQIHASVDDWTGGGLPRDDMTLLVLEVPGAPLTPETHNAVMHNI